MKIAYINKVELQGCVGDYIFWKKAKNGKTYVSFQLATNQSSEYVSYYETDSREFVKIIVFNNRKKFVDRLKAAGLRRGMWIALEGKLQTSKIEIKGNPIIQLVVHPYKIWVFDKEGNKNEI